MLVLLCCSFSWWFSSYFLNSYAFSSFELFTRRSCSWKLLDTLFSCFSTFSFHFYIFCLLVWQTSYFFLSLFDIFSLIWFLFSKSLISSVLKRFCWYFFLSIEWSNNCFLSSWKIFYIESSSENLACSFPVLEIDKTCRKLE